MEQTEDIKFFGAGIVTFRGDKILLVKTHAGFYSFPKGTKEEDETDMETAKREFEEETGIDPKDVCLIKDKYSRYVEVDEMSDSGEPSVKYYVGCLDKDVNDFKFDKDELVSVGWYTVDEALKLVGFRDRRKNILKKAYDMVKTHK